MGDAADAAAKLAKHALDAKSVAHIAKAWYDKNGPFAGEFKMATPLRRACCNAPDGRTWSVLYAVTPDTSEEYWAQFTFAPKASSKRGLEWEVTSCNLQEGAGSEEHVELRLDHGRAAAVAKAWYDNESAYAGDYAMVAPVLGTYCNTPDGSTWSVKYRTEPDAGGDVFVKFVFALTTLKQRGAGVAWEVVHMGEDDPSEKDVAPTSAATSRASGGGAAASKRRRGSGTADDGASQKRSRPSASSSRRKAAAGGGDADGSAHQQHDGGSSEAVADDAVYLSLDNEQPQQIAAKLGVELAMLLELNKPVYKGLTARAKLQPGTRIALPPRGAGWYEALKDETPKLIAAKMKVDGGVDAIVDLNKPMHKRLSPGSKLQAGTKLLMPGDGCSWHYHVQRADGTVASIAEKLKVEDIDNFVAINAGIFGPELVAESELPEGTKLLVPAGADSHFLTKRRRRGSGTADDGASQKRSRPSASSSRRKAAADADGSAHQQQDNDAPDDQAGRSSEAVADDAVYLSLDNEQPQQIAAKLGVELAMLLELNKPVYKGLTARAKLQPGTQIALPPRGAGWYEALKDETPKLIAAKMKVDGGVDAIVDLNKPMYKRLSPGSKLQAGTKLLMPGDGCSWHYHVQRADGTVASIAEKLKVEDIDNFVAINAGIFGPELVAESELPEGTKLLVPAGADSHFLTTSASATAAEPQKQRARSSAELAAAKAESEAQQIITRITPPKRTKLSSEEHEKMHTIWDILCSVGDGFGRSRSESFMTLPKRTNFEYYLLIDDPISLGQIRKRIVKSASLPKSKGKARAKDGGWEAGTSLTYADMDEFEAAMTLLFENARLYYKDVDEVAYADAEVLQDVFWQAFQAMEAGMDYKVEPTGKKISGAGAGRRRSRVVAGLVSEDEEDQEVTSKASGGGKRAKGRSRGAEYDGESDNDEVARELDKTAGQEESADEEDSDSDGSFDDITSLEANYRKKNEKYGDAAEGRQKGGNSKCSEDREGRQVRFGKGERGPWQLAMNEDDWEFVEHHFESFNIEEVEMTLDRENLPRCVVGDIVGIYSLLRNLQSELGLGVFLLDELFCALAAPSGAQNRLLTDVHVMLLRALNMPQVNTAMSDRTGDSDHYLLYWLNLNAHNWPELMRRYAELYVSQPLDPTAAEMGFDPLVPQARRAAQVLATQEYWCLPPSAKVELLRFLTDALYCRGEETAENGIQPYLQERLEQMEQRKQESAQGSPSGDNDDDCKGVNCATCSDGGELICCDLCCCSYHSDGCALMPDGSPMVEMPADDEKWYCGYCTAKDAFSVNMDPLGMHEVPAEGNSTTLTRFWFVGGHIFGENVSTGTFSPWSKWDVEALLRHADGTDDTVPSSEVSDELRAAIEEWLPVLRDTPIPQALCDVFRPAAAVPASEVAETAGSGGGGDVVAMSTAHGSSPAEGGIETKSSDGPVLQVDEDEFHGEFVNKNASSRYLKPVATAGLDVYWDHRSGGWWYYNVLSQSSSWEEPNVPSLASAPSPRHNHGLVFDPRNFSEHYSENAAAGNPSIMMAPPSAGPDVGGSIQYCKDQYWTLHEMLHVLMLVRRDGLGDWGLKAKLLGGRRSADAVRRWFTTTHSAISVAPHQISSREHAFHVFDRKWPAQPYGEALRGTPGGEVSLCSLEHVKSSMLALECMIPPQYMTHRWSYQGLRENWVNSMHTATTGRELAKLLEQFEMEMDENLMVTPWYTTTGWVTDFDQQDNVSHWKDTNLKRKRKQWSVSLNIERLSAIPDKIAAMRASKKSREAAAIATTTQVDASNIVSGRRRRSTHNYAEENSAGWDGSARQGASEATSRGRGRGRGRGRKKKRGVGRPKKEHSDGVSNGKTEGDKGAVAPTVAPNSVSGVVQLAFDQEVALRSMNAMTEVDICSTLDTTFIDVLHTARKDPADVVPPHRRKRGSRRNPYPAEWGDLPSHGPYRVQRWDIREQASDVDRAVYREISKSRLRKLARSAGALQMTGFQYFLPGSDSDHPHYGRSYGEIVLDKDKDPAMVEARKQLDTPPMMNLCGAWRIQVRKAQTIAAVELQLGCLNAAINIGELCTVDLCDRPLVPPLSNDTALCKSLKPGSPVEWQVDPEREGWMHLAVRATLDSMVTALELRELEAAARQRSAANAAAAEAIEAYEMKKAARQEEAEAKAKEDAQAAKEVDKAAAEDLAPTADAEATEGAGQHEAAEKSESESAASPGVGDKQSAADVGATEGAGQHEAAEKSESESAASPGAGDKQSAADVEATEGAGQHEAAEKCESESAASPGAGDKQSAADVEATEGAGQHEAAEKCESESAASPGAGDKQSAADAEATEGAGQHEAAEKSESESAASPGAGDKQSAADAEATEGAGQHEAAEKSESESAASPGAGDKQSAADAEATEGAGQHEAAEKSVSESAASPGAGDKQSASAESKAANRSSKPRTAQKLMHPKKQSLSSKILLEERSENAGTMEGFLAQHLGGILGMHHPADTDEVQSRRKANDMLRNFDRVRQGREQNQRTTLQFLAPEQEEQPKPTEGAAAAAALAAASAAAAAGEAITARQRARARAEEKAKAETSETFRATWNNEERRLFELAMQLYGARNYDAIAKAVGSRNPEQIRTYSIRRRKQMAKKGLDAEIAHIHLYDEPTTTAPVQAAGPAEEPAVAPSVEDGKAKAAVVDGDVTATATTATTLSAAAAAAAVAATERNQAGSYKDGCDGLSGPTAPLEKDAELYTPVQINVPDHTATTTAADADTLQGATIDGETDTAPEGNKGDDKGDADKENTAPQKVTKFCKLVVEGVEHFVTIPPGLAPGESFVRSLPKAYDSVTLRTLDTGELRMWLQQRGVRQAAVVAKDEQSAEKASATEWKTMYDACLQYIMLKRNDKPVGRPGEGWEPKWSPSHERYFWWHSGTQQSQWEEPTGKPVAAAAEVAADNDNADKVRTTPEDTVKTDKESAAMVAEKTGTLEDNVVDEDGTTAMVTEQAGTPEEMVNEVAETTAMVTDYTGSVATLTQAGGGMADAPQVAVAGTLEAVPDQVQEELNY